MNIKFIIEIQKEIISLVGKKFTVSRLIREIEKNPAERLENMARFTFAFCCDIEDNRLQWNTLRQEYLYHYRKELNELFPGNAFLCRPYVIEKNIRAVFIIGLGHMLREGCFGNISVPQMARIVLTHFDTGYKESTIRKLLFESK